MNEVTLIAAETFCRCAPSGQIHPGGEQGLYVRDTRAVAGLVVRLNGEEPHSLRGRAVSPAAGRFTAWWRDPRDTEPDPKLLLERRRVLSGSLWEQLRLTNHGVEPVTASVTIAVVADFAYIFDVKHGRAGTPFPGEATGDGLAFRHPQTAHQVELRCDPAPDGIDGAGGELRWEVALEPQRPWSLEVSVGFRDRAHEPVWPTRTWDADITTRGARPGPSRWWTVPALRCTDPRLPALAAQAAADLESLLVADPVAPEDRFLAAGSPWFLTLFGRDSIWSALMALPLDVSLAGQTLRVLARRQGTRVDPETEEQPGKILHEVRHGGLFERSDLPPVYFGTMDATPLFVTLLHEAWRWGLPEEEVRALLPAAERALAWMRDHGDPDGDGFLEYRRSGGRGLDNQGWKDSSDGIQFADGRLADAPIALCEVQGYAYDAAVRGAELLDAFGRAGGAGWRQWAAALRERFRERFW
ncbi:MAG TPA: glycogen debranching N-terminal domain-containing protein, partial [Egibacteraceae bacterium]|nr:glycogen debranching N-terminal domain-containing protein [Egibacteraceae bacterium]